MVMHPYKNLCPHDLKSVWFKLYHTKNPKTVDQDEANQYGSTLYANLTISGALSRAGYVSSIQPYISSSQIS